MAHQLWYVADVGGGGGTGKLNGAPCMGQEYVNNTLSINIKVLFIILTCPNYKANYSAQV
jgi:hypothetical protein